MEIFQRLSNMIEDAMGKLVVGYIRTISRQLNDLGVLKYLAEDEAQWKKCLHREQLHHLLHGVLLSPRWLGNSNLQGVVRKGNIFELLEFNITRHILSRVHKNWTVNAVLGNKFCEWRHWGSISLAHHSLRVHRDFIGHGLFHGCRKSLRINFILRLYGIHV